jgi:AsmA protein
MTQTLDNSGMQQPLHRFLLWRIAAVIAIPLFIIVLGTGLVLQSFNPNSYAPVLVTALEQATGRQVTLNGPVKIRWSLTPAIQANDIAIANPPRFSDPNLLTLGGLRAEIALFPLFSHHVDILRLVLLAPHLTLERLPNGAADWNLSTANAHPTAGLMSLLDARFKVALEAVEIEDGLLTIRTSNDGMVGTIHFAKLTGTATSLSAPLHLTAQAQIGKAPFDINGIVGPVERFSGIGSDPWPIDLNVTMANATLHITGTVAHPRDATGYDFRADLNIPSLDALGRVLPAFSDNKPLPPIQNIIATVELKDRNAKLPAIDDLTVTAGKSDLATLRPGLVLNGLYIRMAALDQPLSIAATGSSNIGDFNLQGQFGPLQTLISPAWLPADTSASGNFPISIAAKLGNADATLTGAIATPQNLSGAALAVTASIPDLSALSGVAGTALPAWKNIAFQTSLIDPGGEGLYNVIGLDDINVTMDDAAFGGAATLNLAPQPKLQLSLNFTQANLDALLAAYPQTTAASVTPLAAPATTPVPQPANNASIIPDTPLPLGFLSWGNGDIQLAGDNILWNGANYTALQANIQLANKVLTINPFTGEIPGGNISASATLDASQTPTTESLAVKAPALALGPLLQALKLQGTAEGNLQLQLSTTSTGDTLHQIASNLTGQLGVASVNAKLDSGLLNRAFGPAMKAAGLPPVTVSQAAVRCFGVLLNANQGVATLKSSGIDASQLFLQGSGSLNLGQESYAITLQPADGAQILLGGSFAQPAWTAAPQNISVPPPPHSNAPTRPDICPIILASARLGQAGASAAPPLSSSVTPRPTPTSTSAPKNLLNSLLITPP